MDVSGLAQDIASRYEEQLELYRVLLSVARRLNDTLQAGDDDRIQGLLDEQGKCAEAIDRSQETLSSLRRGLAAAFGYPDLTLRLLSGLEQPPPQLRRVHEAMQQIAAILSELSSVFAENQRLLEGRLSAVRAQQKSLNRGKSAVQAYRGPVAEDARFLDRRS